VALGAARPRQPPVRREQAQQRVRGARRAAPGAGERPDVPVAHERPQLLVEEQLGQLRPAPHRGGDKWHGGAAEPGPDGDRAVQVHAAGTGQELADPGDVAGLHRHVEGEGVGDEHVEDPQQVGILYCSRHCCLSIGDGVRWGG
jgi:hypothetical protein